MNRMTYDSSNKYHLYLKIINAILSSATNNIILHHIINRKIATKNSKSPQLRNKCGRLAKSEYHNRKHNRIESVINNDNSSFD